MSDSVMELFFKQQSEIVSLKKELKIRDDRIAFLHEEKRQLIIDKKKMNAELKIYDLIFNNFTSIWNYYSTLKGD